MPNQIEMNCDDAHLVLPILGDFCQYQVSGIRVQVRFSNEPQMQPMRTIKNLEIINHGICIIVVSETDVGRWAVQISPI